MIWSDCIVAQVSFLWFVSLDKRLFSFHISTTVKLYMQLKSGHWCVGFGVNRYIYSKTFAKRQK